MPQFDSSRGSAAAKLGELLPPAAVDALLAEAEASGTPIDGPDGLLAQMTKAVLERALDVEIADHLGYEHGDPAGHGSGNSRNGHGRKTVLTTAGPVDLEVPRDRNGTFSPAIVPKRKRRLGQVEDMILSLYARGMSTRDITEHLGEVYGAQVSAATISRVTDVVTEEIAAWQSRPVDPVYPILYIDAIRNFDIVFGIGPAGTGKTYLAVAMAVSALTNNQVRSIILTRPAVEAGEKLGFLPGDLAQKVNPYLRPLHDALNDMLGAEKSLSLQEQGIIEIAPLAFMRGRTLSNAFIILDEAQNTTREQMKMFLTRIGFDSKAVITGDSTQVDLPDKQHSGLIDARKILKQVEGIEFCSFSKEDVVRHPLVQKIIHAYEQIKN